MSKGASSDTEQYANARLTVDVVIFSLCNGDLQVLLVSRGRGLHEGRWAIPGGAVGVGERLDAAAGRTLTAQTGITEVFLEQLYTFGGPDPDPRKRTITVAYYAALPTQALNARAAGDIEAVRWWPVRSLPPLDFDHAKIVEYAATRLRYKVEYTAVAFELLAEEFTLSELQQVHEAVLGEALDKRNFRRKILGANVVQTTGGRRTGEGRPARLYRYREDAVAEVQARRPFP
jgi:8-oxo-dGTP diphosphatase